MRCKKCGANNEEVNSYCVNCGNKLVNSPKESGVVLNYSMKPLSVKETLVNGFITAILGIFAVILLFIYPIMLFLILSVISWIWIIIYRFKSFTSRRYFYYILSRMMGVVFIFLMYIFLNSSQYLIGLTTYMFYIATISFVATCGWLTYNIFQDKNILKIILS